MKFLSIVSVFFSFLITTTPLMAQKKCDITKAYQEIFDVTKDKWKEQEYLTVQINKVDSTKCFGKMINEQERNLSYILSQFENKDSEREILKINEPKKLKDAYVKILEADATFNNLMKEWVAKTIDHTLPKDSISFEEVLNVAVKFFAVTKPDEKGYGGKICVTFNELHQTENVRKPFLEAFCIASILKNIKNKDLNIWADFSRSLQKLKKINFGVQEQERLLRAQGAMFMMMYNNDTLHQIIQKEYEKQQQYLPFILKK